MTDASRTFYEYPATHASIHALQQKSLGGFLPTKTKRSWGELLKIPTKSKKDRDSSAGRIYAASLNISPVNAYSSPGYIQQQQYRPSYPNQDFKRNYEPDYRNNYGSKDAFSPSSLNSPSPTQPPPISYPAKSQLKNGTNSVRYTDWFGSVVSRKSPVRPSLQNFVQYNEPSTNLQRNSWGTYISPQTQSNLVEVTPVVPLRVYSNVCLCPDQLFSTKSKKRKKCKKCGCKTATVKNATATTPNRIRPAIPHNLYQAPTPMTYSWPQYEQSAYATPSPYIVQPYLNGFKENEVSTNSTPEVAESEKSVCSIESFSKANGVLSPQKSIPPPPTVPLPSIPDSLQILQTRSEKALERNSIISDSKTAYDLMEDDKHRSGSSDTDDLSDNVVEQIERPQNEEARRINVISIGGDPTPLIKREANVNIITNDSINRNEENKIKIFTSPMPNGSAYIPKGVPKHSTGTTHEDSNESRNSIPKLNSEDLSCSCDKNDDQHSRQCKRRARTGSGFSHHHKLGSSEILNNSSHVKKKLKTTTSRTLNDGGKPFVSKIPHRDESKVICIAGQRILFDKNLASKQNGVTTDNHTHSFGIESWEATPENSWDMQCSTEDQDGETFKRNNISANDLKYGFSPRRPLQSTQRRNLFMNGEPKKNSVVSFRTTNTIHEEDEDIEDQEIGEELSKGTTNGLFNGLNESQSEDDSLEDSPLFTRNHEESEDTEKEGRSSSSTSSPERGNNFKTTLSELLQVKSILKRPNSVDTSSETDSDFYLPTYSEFKKEQKKKKTVQFHPSHEVALDEPNDEPKNANFSDTTSLDRSKSYWQIQNVDTHEEDLHQENYDRGTYNSKTNGDFDINDRPISLLTSHLNGPRTTEEVDQNRASIGLSLGEHDARRRSRTKPEISFKTPTRLVKGNSPMQKGSSVPSRPTVPPPPPPPPSHEVKAGQTRSSSDISPLGARDEFIRRELSKVISSKSHYTHRPPSPPETPPPPLPLSPPPPLSKVSLPAYDSGTFSTSDSFPTFSSFREPKPDDSASSHSSSTTYSSSQTPLTHFEACEDISSFNKSPPVFSLNDEEESHTATIRGRVKASRPSLPSNMNLSSSPRKVSPPSGQISSPSSREFLHEVKGTSSCQSSQSSSQKSFISSMMEETDTDERFSDHIYEELPSMASSPIGDGNFESSSQEKSIFDGASKYEILEFLQDAKMRVNLEDENAGVITNETLETHLEEMKLEDEDEQCPVDNPEDSLSPSRYKDGRSSNRSSNSESSENSGLVRFDKERLPSAEIERTDSGVGSETSKPNLKIRKSARNSMQNSSIGSHGILRDRELPPCDDCDSPVEAKVTNSGLMYAPLVCRRCSRRRQERKEIITEIMETEVKYGRDLRVMVDQFYRPMQVAALLTRDQLSRIFLNIEDLIDHNRQFALQLRDAYEIAVDQGDEDLLTVNIARLFLQASDMLHAFQNYCVRQSAASLLLQTLEKDRELLRIFLKVSQMENTLLRRMNLHSFLMVPVQRITKYPLLLSRLFKATPQSHSSREDCRRAREKIELFLHHINSETKETSPTKLWRRISLSVGSSSLAKRPLQPPDYDASLKLRAVALEVLEWRSEDAYMVREGRLQFLPPESNNWTRRGRGLKMAPVQMVLLTLGRPTSTLEEEIPEDGLVTPRDLGIREAAILAFKDNRVSKASLIRDPWLLTKNILSWDEEGETEFFDISDLISKETYIFKDRDAVSTAEWFRLLQFHALAVGCWRRRRKALPNIMIHGAKRPSY